MSEWYHHHIPATPSIAYLVVCVQVLLRRAALGAAIFHALLILKNDLHKTLDTPVKVMVCDGVIILVLVA